MIPAMKKVMNFSSASEAVEIHLALETLGLIVEFSLFF